jgi:3-oxoadipate enol-lactonase
VTKLHYHRSGDGPPLVLIHGGFLDHRMWSDTHVALSANYDVISYDVRGAGESVRDDLAHFPADDLNALLAELKIGRAVLVGLSMGARIAFELAATQPERIHASVLCSLALPEFVTSDCNGLLPEFVRSLTEGQSEDATQLFTRMWFDGRRKASSIHAARRANFVELVDLTFASTFVHQQWRTLDEIGPVEKILTPTLFLTGRDDWPDIHDTAAALDARMPQSSAVSIQDAAHTVNFDQPRALLRNINSFLASHA